MGGGGGVGGGGGCFFFFFFNDTATTEIYTLSLHDALPIYGVKVAGVATQVRKGKVRRYRYGYATEASTKKATVKLAEGSVIELF